MDKLKEEVRLIIAFALAIIIIMVFGRIQARQSGNMAQKQHRQSPSSPMPETAVSPDKQLHESLPDTLPDTSVPEGAEKAYDDGRYIMDVDTATGSLKNIGMRKYQRKNEPFFEVLSNAQILLDSVEGEGHATHDISLWDENAGMIKFNGQAGKNISIEKSITVPSDSHTFKSEIVLSSQGEETRALTYILQAGRTGAFSTAKKGEREFSPPEIIVKTDSQMVKINPARMKEDAFYENTRWIVLKQRYSMLMVKAESGTKGYVTKKDNFVNFGFIYDNINIEKNSSKKINLSFYAGPSDYFVARNEIPEKELFGNGFFASMGRFLFTLLSYIHKVIPNWGWAIIVLTLIIKILFYPLTKNSLKSMKALQKLRPYLQEIQKKYKNNPQQMQKEMMNLYKDYKINPLGGCIPMLLQFPIFIGFFLALRSSIFFRGAPFGLWIQDLSLPDTIARIGGFNLNILPVIMAVTSLWQQKLTPQEPSQKTLTYMMPVMFLFLFYNFSSGLLLYWITMNAAGLVEQYFIHRK